MIVVITGPTGVGKTRLSVALAKKYQAIIINADSMQVYRELNIGTAKIKEEEKEGIEHYLFDIADPKEMYTVYDYQKDLRGLLDKYKDRNIIIVGGTGLYINAGLYDYNFNDSTSYNSYDDLTNEELYLKVREKYPLNDIHINNRKRLVRALNKRENYSLNGDKLLYDVIFVGLTTTRDVLYERINARVDKMFEEGLVNEVKSLYDNNVTGKAIDTGIGYKELIEYFNQKISLKEAKDLIKKRSRNYAKRQYTWFKNKMNIKWFDVNFDDFDQTINRVSEYIKEMSD